MEPRAAGGALDGAAGSEVRRRRARPTGHSGAPHAAPVARALRRSDAVDLSNDVGSSTSASASATANANHGSHVVDPPAHGRDARARVRVLTAVTTTALWQAWNVCVSRSCAAMLWVGRSPARQYSTMAAAAVTAALFVAHDGATARHSLALALFERGWAVVNLMAFGSFLAQWRGLVGSGGITPVDAFMDDVRASTERQARAALERRARREARSTSPTVTAVGTPVSSPPASPDSGPATPETIAADARRSAAAVAAVTNDSVRRAAARLRWRRWPTVFWIVGGSDAAVLGAQLAAITAAVALFFGVAPGIMCLVLGLLYLSLKVVSQPWLGLQMDANIVETNVLYAACWPFAAGLFGGLRGGAVAQPFVAVFVLRWLVFRTMLGCGICKYASRDKSWRSLTALCFHYFTQPIPNPLSATFHRLPEMVHKLEAVVTFVVEGPVSFLVFGTPVARLAAFVSFVALTAGINVSGNYGFLGWLTIVECLALLDDSQIVAWLPDAVVAALTRFLTATSGLGSVAAGIQPRAVDDHDTAVVGAWDVLEWGATLPHHVAASVMSTEWLSMGGIAASLSGVAPWVLVALPYVLVSWVPLVLLLRQRVPTLAWLEAPPWLSSHAYNVFRNLSPYRVVNRYSKFGTMSTVRWELVLQGSADNRTWHEYVWPSKPGPVDRRPPVLAPHNHRLDWRIWFLGSPTKHFGLGTEPLPSWFNTMLKAILRGDKPDVLYLFSHNPFPLASEPPKFVRLRLYDYRMPRDVHVATEQPHLHGWFTQEASDSESDSDEASGGAQARGRGSDAADGASGGGAHSSSMAAKRPSRDSGWEIGRWWARKRLFRSRVYSLTKTPPPLTEAGDDGQSARRPAIGLTRHYT